MANNTTFIELGYGAVKNFFLLIFGSIGGTVWGLTFLFLFIRIALVLVKKLDNWLNQPAPTPASALPLPAVAATSTTTPTPNPTPVPVPAPVPATPPVSVVIYCSGCCCHHSGPITSGPQVANAAIPRTPSFVPRASTDNVSSVSRIPRAAKPVGITSTEKCDKERSKHIKLHGKCGCAIHGVANKKFRDLEWRKGFVYV
ncbi:hypothetical protein PRK78_002496 [Emydomyces testavorans]|uniref:Uncharacterized protein n=1 Tax=Emydomyces testavorans TaxID=2070801 RepID=A0AAF0DGG4_9EURO|nr:hypothetical protein PRK78_002496 [Emydomyces testavorans]